MKFTANSYGESWDSSRAKSWIQVQYQWVPVRKTISSACKLTQKLIFRSIDRSLCPTGHMPWFILRLWRFLYIREAGRRGYKITVYSVLLSKWTYKTLSLAMYMWGRLCMTILYTLGSRELAWKPPRYKSQLSFYLRSFCFPFVFGYVNLYANEGETKEKSKLPEIK